MDLDISTADGKLIKVKKYEGKKPMLRIEHRPLRT
jgi:hypothetical protein